MLYNSPMAHNDESPASQASQLSKEVTLSEVGCVLVFEEAEPISLELVAEIEAERNGKASLTIHSDFYDMPRWLQKIDGEYDLVGDERVILVRKLPGGSVDGKDVAESIVFDSVLRANAEDGLPTTIICVRTDVRKGEPAVYYTTAETTDMGAEERDSSEQFDYIAVITRHA